MELDETIRSKEALEKASFAMMEEIRTVKSRLESQASDFTTVALDLRNKSRKLEDDTRHVVRSRAPSKRKPSPRCTLGLVAV